MPQAAGRRRPPWILLTLLALLLGFGAAVLHLIELRFARGDVYPPYSTLRSDPLGTKVLFESLREVSGLVTERSLRPLDHLSIPTLARVEANHGEADAACFYLGADGEQWPHLFSEGEVHRLEKIMESGGRVIVTFQPTTHRPIKHALDHGADHAGTGGAKDKQKPKDGSQKKERRAETDLSANWAIDFSRGPAASRKPGTDVTMAVPVDNDKSLGAVPWRTVVDFQIDTDTARQAGWRALYTRAGEPVIVARPFGGHGGELILSSDTYFLSNEGLHALAPAELLATLIGPARRVIFDESHFGIEEHPGVITLARRYRLQGALGVLALLAALFVWRQTGSLVPPRSAGGAEDPDAVSGREASEALLNLLRRGVPPRDLPARCVAEWRRHASPAAGGAGAGELRERATPSNVARVEEVLAHGPTAKFGNGSAAAVYRELCARLRPPTRDPVTPQEVRSEPR